MADNGSNSGVVAVVAIFVIVVVVGFLAMRSGMLGGGGDAGAKDIDVKIDTPIKDAAPAAPAAPAGGDAD